MSAPDYSEYLTPERLVVEEAAWESSAMYQVYAAELVSLLREYNLSSVIEIGCGTGWVPTCLPGQVAYMGIDANWDCVKLAAEKNIPDYNSRMFVQIDIRNFEVISMYDVVCSFAVLKHFALAEWSDIVRKVLSFGRFGVFTMNVGPEDVDDDSQGYPHTWVTVETLSSAVESAGHVITRAELLHTGETMVRTRAI